MIYRTNNGTVIEAEGLIELVCKLNEGSKFGKRDDLAQFMTETAVACNLQSGGRISAESPERFIADMLAEGFLEIVGESGISD